MKKIVAIVLTSGTALLAGCGGSSGDAGTANVLLTGGTSLQSPYLGTWQAPCDGHERQILVVTLKADGSGAYELTPTTETYQKAGCNGALLGTESMSASISAAPDGVADVLIKLAGSDGVSDVRIDKLTLSMPAYSFQVSGPGVQYVLKDGLQQWCIAHDDGETCLHDDGRQTARTIAGGMLLRNNALYTVVQYGSEYLPDLHYVKK